jgi:DNA-binding NtrC family response regulator
VRVELPPLRKRKEDIPLLTTQFLKEFHGDDALSQVMNFDKTMEAFRNYDWPGNVRELRNLVEIAFYSGRRPVDLEASLYLSRMKTREDDVKPDHPADRPFKVAKGELIMEFEKDYIKDLLRKHDGNISKAAREAGIERAYLQRLIKKYDLK